MWQAAVLGVLFGGLVFATAAATTMFVALLLEGLDVRRRGGRAQAWRLARPATGIVAALFAVSIGMAWLLVKAFVPSSLGDPYDVGAGAAMATLATLAAPVIWRDFADVERRRRTGGAL